MNPPDQPTPDLAPTRRTESEMVAASLMRWSVLPISGFNHGKAHDDLRKGAATIRTLERELTAATAFGFKEHAARVVAEDSFLAAQAECERLRDGWRKDRELIDQAAPELAAVKAKLFAEENNRNELSIQGAELARLRAENELTQAKLVDREECLTQAEATIESLRAEQAEERRQFRERIDYASAEIVKWRDKSEAFRADVERLTGQLDRTASLGIAYQKRAMEAEAERDALASRLLTITTGSTCATADAAMKGTP